MSYGFRVKFVDGKPEAFDMYGEPPTKDETISVNGHDSDYMINGVNRGQVSIGATLVDSDGFSIVSANGYRAK